jgi:hypothetical protein
MRSDQHNAPRILHVGLFRRLQAFAERQEKSGVTRPAALRKCRLRDAVASEGPNKVVELSGAWAMDKRCDPIRAMLARDFAQLFADKS